MSNSDGERQNDSERRREEETVGEKRRERAVRKGRD